MELLFQPFKKFEFVRERQSNEVRKNQEGFSDLTDPHLIDDEKN